MAGGGQVTASRRAALEVLQRVRGGDLADRAFDHLAQRLDSRDRGWAQELVYGTFRLRGRIDHMLGALLRDGLASLDPDVLDVLRLGAYQLLEMDSVPAYAAVSQSVDLARIAGAPRAAGLVNGVLQNLQRRRETLRFPDFDRDPAAYLETWGSHPRWLVERWIARWGADDARALVEADDRRPELYIRPLGISADEARARLGEAEIASEPVAFSPDSVKILPPAGALEALAAVPAVVQDPAAALVVRYAAVPEGATVIDLAAAPGGKALGMAERAAHVAAADLSPRRIARVAENAARIGWGGRIGPVVADSRHPPFRAAGAVLLDAPCTGTGTFRRHPDGRWRVTPDDLAALAALQTELLEAAAALVKPGGVLVYSTCSLEREENEERVEAFLADHPDFEPRPEPGTVPAELVDAAGRLCVLPQRQGVDGAFAARLGRRG
ncbi:16S rRNA (cytosine(967)-C(5))-methyltransferase RsmB [Longimicrobium sp.]|uniref:16S rRNA (cytosine(967)-C(5))-methyltransferase RsmB n=1 Tax=Longimicrobium sp. TaxID=2029185 RepID=UPI002B66677D|nr:16S rRNA (cytosine(967)-C(5))-methyltransferase RsmB [Longimicrobium sp.]HSU16701.1 16S rRNA (cytosine(967)-C(5))-methyltransferase RsmB [Longimicrobium sp.]